MSDDSWVFVIVALAAVSIWFGSMGFERKPGESRWSYERWQSFRMLFLGIFLMGLVIARGVYSLIRG
jgi:hypothetical protein